MHIAGLDGPGHLSYCTNIHAGESWSDLFSSLKTHVPRIREAVAPGVAFGLGLRIGAEAAGALSDTNALAQLKQFLAESDCYVFTINGFPYGPFHAQSVKENVYAPDWLTEERLEYSNTLADVLCELLPEGMEGTISTVPGTFKGWLNDNHAAFANQMVKHVAHLVKLRAQSGKTIALALEPEPFCMLETIAETVEFFTSYLFHDNAAENLAAQTGLSKTQAHDALRRHLGVCYDVCHAAVEFEDPRDSVLALQQAGIPISKVQLSSALRVARVSAATAQLLAPFAEPVYLHQVIERSADENRQFLDLPHALAQIDQSEGAEWRIHFHVPIFVEKLEAFDTTQDFLAEILDLFKANPFSSHLEVETYTWDVLPPDLRNVSVTDAIARELNWVKARLGV